MVVLHTTHPPRRPHVCRAAAALDVLTFVRETDRRDCQVGVLGLLVRLRGHHDRGRVLRRRRQGGGPAVETALL